MDLKGVDSDFLGSELKLLIFIASLDFLAMHDVVVNVENRIYFNLFQL